jgi:hypothetical protein
VEGGASCVGVGAVGVVGGTRPVVDVLQRHIITWIHVCDNSGIVRRIDTSCDITVLVGQPFQAKPSTKD